MSEPLNQLEDLKQRLSNGSITALVPALLYFSDNCWDENIGFKNNESLLLLKQIQDNASKLREMENQANMGTGIPHFALFMCSIYLSDFYKIENNAEETEKFAKFALDFLEESLERDFCWAYTVAGRAFFFGDSLLKKDEEQGLQYLKKATELPVSEYIGIDKQAFQKYIINEYESCLAIYEKKRQEEEKVTPLADAPKSTQITSTAESQKIVLPTSTEKLFTSKHYWAVVAMFLVYTLLSVLLRREFDLVSAYEIAIEKGPFLGILATILLNYGVVLWLLMAYFYRKNNGKHNVFLVIGYIVILIGCMVDGILPYREAISKGLLFKYKKYWINALIYPAVFLVSHRLVSLLIYAILRSKEGDSDYRIYLGFVLFAPFTAGVLLIGAIGYLLLTGQASGAGTSSTGSNTDPLMASINLQKYVRQQIINRGGLTKFAIYYDDNGYNYGWKGVDYWDNAYALTEVTGEWGYICFQTPEGKIYRIRTHAPDKEKIYFFD